tara:strand:+ start:753 stop:950 length:198 start_codon:yes stop_codon:yes gene_type:complete
MSLDDNEDLEGNIEKASSGSTAVDMVVDVEDSEDVEDVEDEEDVEDVEDDNGVDADNKTCFDSLI